MFGILFFVCILGYAFLIKKTFNNIGLCAALFLAFSASVLLNYIFVILFSSYNIAPYVYIISGTLLFVFFIIRFKTLSITEADKKGLIIYACTAFLFTALLYGTNHGIYHDGWFAGAVDKVGWIPHELHKRTGDAPWELYYVAEDFSMANDLAAEMPEKVAEMKKLFFEEGIKHNVFPLDVRAQLILSSPEKVGRPTVMGDRKEITLGAGMGGYGEHAFLNLKNHSYTITAEVEVAPGHTDGVIFAQGGRFGGYSLYVKDGVPTFCYNWVGLERYYVRAPKALTDERNQIKYEFQYDGGFSAGGKGILTVNGQKVAEGRIEHTMGVQISFDETADVGIQPFTPVTEEYTAQHSAFQGKIFSVNIKRTD